MTILFVFYLCSHDLIDLLHRFAILQWLSIHYYYYHLIYFSPFRLFIPLKSWVSMKTFRCRFVQMNRFPPFFIFFVTVDMSASRFLSLARYPSRKMAYLFINSPSWLYGKLETFLHSSNWPQSSPLSWGNKGHVICNDFNHALSELRSLLNFSSIVAP